ncbi:MAG: hypothetical protein RID91_06240, partial [Azospirillaceae bacterium]
GQVFADLLAALARPQNRQGLLGHGLYSDRMTADEAALRYFEAVLERRLSPVRRETATAAHRFYQALCQRHPSDRLAEAEIVECASDGATPLVADESLRALRRRLEAACAEEAADEPGRERPAVALAAPAGPALPLPRRMSLWDAIRLAPSPVRSLPPGAPFNRFCSATIKLLESVNRPFAEFVALGLCPFDWLDAVPVNQARGINRFLKTLRAGAPAAAGDDRGRWQAAWDHAPVPGFGGFEAFWRSDIAAALRQARPPETPGVDHPDNPDEDADPRFLDETAFEQHLAALGAAGVVDPVSRRVFRELYDGARLADLAAADWVRAEARRRDQAPETMIRAMAEAALAHARTAAAQDQERQARR